MGMSYESESEEEADSVALFGSQGDKATQEGYNKPKYTELTGLKDQVKSYGEQVKRYEDRIKTLEDEVKDLKEQLSKAHSKLTTKENLVKQHAKVAKEADSGREASAAKLKNHLESVTLLKLTPEGRAAQLDGALKEDMRQIRKLEEDLECSLEKLQQMKLEKENMVMELSRSNENFETKKSQLSETEHQLSEVESQLTAAQKLNIWSETQLNCMAESYNLLEVRATGLQSRVNLLESKIEMLEEERTKYKDTNKDLQEQLQRIETSPIADVDAKSNQEQDREMSAATVKVEESRQTVKIHQNHDSDEEEENEEELATNGTNSSESRSSSDSNKTCWLSRLFSRKAK